MCEIRYKAADNILHFGFSIGVLILIDTNLGVDGGHSLTHSISS